MYLINGKIAESKSLKGPKIKNIFRKAAKQKAEILVIDLHNSNVTTSDIINATGKFLKFENVHPKLKELIIVSKAFKIIEKYLRSAVQK